jgi:hypothetical protein
MNKNLLVKSKIITIFLDKMINLKKINENFIYL